MTGRMTLSSDFNVPIPQAMREKRRWREGQELVFIPKGQGLLLMPVPTLQELEGIARGADADDYRDREDRY